MPELPEVETIRRILAPQLTGRVIRHADIRNAQVIAYPEASVFAASLEGQRIAGLTRRGKFLTLHLKSGDRLTLHLRMTGQLLVMPAETPTEKHTRLIFTCSDGRQLRLIDVRRFGRFWFLRAQEADTVTGQAELGPEPADPALTAEYLAEKLGARRSPIKEMLYDQSIAAGIGSICSDEILFAARLHPQAKSAALSTADWERLAAKIREVMAWAVDVSAMTAEEYLRRQGKAYRSMPYLRVYGRAGQPCPVCGTPLEKVTVGSRSSSCCPVCQRMKPC